MNEFSPSTETQTIPATASLQSELENSPFYPVLIDAVTRRRKIKMRYNTDRLERTFSPYIFNLCKNGNCIVSGMQDLNPNKPDDDNARRTFSFLVIQTMELTEDEFIPIDTFSASEPNGSTGIIACVLPPQSNRFEFHQV